MLHYMEKGHIDIDMLRSNLDACVVCCEVQRHMRVMRASQSLLVLLRSVETLKETYGDISQASSDSYGPSLKHTKVLASHRKCSRPKPTGKFRAEHSGS